MRTGTIIRNQGRIGFAVAFLILTAIAFATATSGLHITAGSVAMSMDMTSENGLHLRFGKASDV
ncbi:MAG: hypothetical protein AAFO57_01455 [Pseudomonadota bacterium]